MKKRFVAILLLTVIFAILAFSACTSQEKEQAAHGTLHYTDFTGKRIGAALGSVSEQIITNILNGTPVQYSEHTAGFEDARRGRIDGYMTDMSTLRVIAAAPGNEEFICVEVPAEVFSAPMGAFSANQDIIDRFNIFLAEVKADGTLDDMQNRWLNTVPDLDSPMPIIPLSGEGDILMVATTGLNVPFSYVGANNELKGYSVELAIRFAAHEGMNIKFEAMEFGSLIPHIVSGKGDLGIANTSITEERRQSVLFTDSIYEDTLGILISNPNTTVSTAASRSSYADFANTKLGVLTGSVSDAVAQEFFNATRAFYSESSAAIEDIRKGRIDGYLIDLSLGKTMAAAPGNENMIFFEIPAEIYCMPTGAISMEQSMIDRFNDFLAGIKNDGTLEEMQNRWLHTFSDLNMPSIPLTGINGTLMIATSAIIAPFSFVGENGELMGYNIELARRFAAHEGMDVEFADMEFAGLIPYIIAGKADLAIANISITEERKQSVLFTDSVYDDQLGILALNQSDSQPGSVDYTFFSGKNVGMRTGTVFDWVIEHIGGTPAFYSDISAGIEDARKGRVDGFMSDLSSMRVLVAMPGNDDLECVEIPADIFGAPMGAISLNQGMIDRFNDFLSVLIADGTLDDMQNRWLKTVPDLDSPMPDIPLTGTGGTLKVATSAGSMPFAYMGANNELKGYSIELARRFAAHEGMNIEFAEMEFAGMIPYIISERADFAIADISITEERSKSVMFTEPIYIDGAGVVMLKSRESIAAATAAGDVGGFGGWIKNGIENNLIKDNRWKLIVDGLGATMTISFMAQLFGTIFGGFICFLLMRRNKLVKWLGKLYCGIIHGTPIVVLLMIAYYIVFGSMNVSGIMVAVAAFSMITAAGVAGNLKGAIDTVDPVEVEAARSIGFSAFRAFMTVTLPQAVRRALPSYTTGFVELVKATAVVGYIAIQDLTRAGDIIRSRTYDAYFPLIFIAVIYLIVTTICIQVFKFCIGKFSRGGEFK